MKRRAVGYLRVSTGLQAEQGMGLEAQRSKVSEYAQAHGLDLVDVVEEVASGGIQDGETFSYEHRPQFLRLLDRAAGREFDVLIVAKFDRLSRHTGSAETAFRTFEINGVHVVSASEGNGDTALGRYFRQNLASIAELERAMIHERLQGGKAERRKRGQNTDGPAPYGYKSTRGRLEVIPDQAAIVLRVYQAARRGESARSIAAALNTDAIPAPRGGSWDHKAILSMTRNRTYRGERHGSKAAHESIIPVRLWNAAQRRPAAE